MDDGNNHRLRAAREARHWSIDVLAERAGLSRRTILRAEQGRGLNPESRRLLCDCLGKTAEELGLSKRRSARPSTAVLNQTDDMDRRDFLRTLSIAGALITAPPVDDALDWERLDHFARRPTRLDSATLDEYAALNAHLWRVYSTITPKRGAFEMVRRQLDVLTGHMERSHTETVHRRLCALTADLLQLSGEIFFDGDRFADAGQTYVLAATAAKEADAFDLWACAMTRHSFTEIYERRFDRAVPMLELADRLSTRGDSALTTRYWVNAVRARALAGIGEMAASERAQTIAENVHRHVGGVPGGWLRFDGSRMAEERGAMFVELSQPDLAEPVLTTVLSQPLSLRRRGLVLTDLATVGAQRRDADQLATYTTAALDVAQQSRSGVLNRKLVELKPWLVPYLADRRIRDLSEQLTAATA